MALIYRAILAVEDTTSRFVDRAPALALDWPGWKAERAGLTRESVELTPGVTSVVGGGLELTCAEAADDDCSVLRVALFEGGRTDATQVKTTFTALSSRAGSVAWVDLDRWVGAGDAGSKLIVELPVALAQPVLEQKDLEGVALP